MVNNFSLEDICKKKPKADYHIIGHNLCPYVQRAVIVMYEKNIPHDRTDIDLDDKPNWLASVCPTGKIPILIVKNNQFLFESNVISEFLDEVSVGSLHPIDPVTKAHHRSWIEFGSQILNQIARIIYHDTSKTSFEATMHKIGNMFELVEKNFLETKKRSNSKFHLVDATYATIFRYFDILTLKSSIDPFVNLPKLQHWRNYLANRNSVQDAVPSNYNSLLIDFIKKQRSYISLQLQHKQTLMNM